MPKKQLKKNPQQTQTTANSINNTPFVALACVLNLPSSWSVGSVSGWTQTPRAQDENLLSPISQITLLLQ